jgi:carbon starvation protein
VRVRLAYRYYSAFIAAKALALDDRRTTPGTPYADGHNYVASPRWVLFGHHFAAIAGAGPLVGPTLAAQFGFAPGFLWLLIGAVLAGCVQDFTVLVASVRHRGRSLADVARTEISPFAGLVAMIAVLFILLVTLAGLGIVVVNALSNSPWGVFTIGMTIPIAVIMGCGCSKAMPERLPSPGPVSLASSFDRRRDRRTLGGADRSCRGAHFHAPRDHDPHGASTGWWLPCFPSGWCWNRATISRPTSSWARLPC